MKYIRTKDEKIIKILKEGIDEFGKYGMVDEENCIRNYDDLKQADTIKELTDVYVIVPKNQKYKPYIVNTLSVFDDIEDVLKHNDIYSSIWVNALLKPVAKMNDKGELELL